ncbi:universal stress protein [Marinobacterium nitratireducens]|uniref:Universal stress protein n=1 Tax=Marinobacterium nitratireducens TaxID=518897 RepID=A0A918DXR5_9GAMM|nr:universal stress protein [Marinobacterium nitratireducens]GGO87624.1 universal stress protein [Marinobacterium nitratireducens]
MFKNILIPVDLEEPDFARPAIEVALRERDPDGGCVHLMTVIPGFASPLVASYFDPATVEKAHEAVDQHLLDFAHKELPADTPHHLTVHQGHPAKRIVEQAEKIHADLIIMSAHHRGRIDHALLGSSSARVVEHAHCSVMILRRWEN